MSIQHGNPISDASTTRPILTPPTEWSHRSSDGSISGSKKRKRDGSTMEDLLNNSFVVKPYPSTTIVKPRALQPLLLLPRSQLPLSYIDITPLHNGLAQSRVFETHVKILELEERMGSQPMVLIARLDDGKSLYAVEREERGIYVLLHLGSWVSLQQLKAAAVVSRPDLFRVSDRSRVLERHLGPSALPQDAPLMTAELNNYSKKEEVAIETVQPIVKRPTINIPADTTPTETRVAEASHEPAKDSYSYESLDINSTSGDVSQPTANEIFENVRTQYFEALYLSKASLAYFAKGPLSKARAAFHLDYESTLDMAEHITFLESLIMSTTVIDKRYRDGISGCVESIDILDQSADDAKNDAGKTKKRRSNKKIKPGKNGLYPMEDILIRRWWAGHDDEADHDAPGTTREDIAKARIAHLRIRETQLQMILILEVLALQPLAVMVGETDTRLPATLPPSVGGGGKEKTAKSKTLERLSTLIDVHIDRLCIWQSIALEFVKTPTDGATSQADSKTLSSSSSINTDNILKDFCVEVILPFFAARLPDRCRSINRKLGGPVIAAPKSKPSKTASTSNMLSRPGAATKRPIPTNPRRSLQRGLTDERERSSASHGSSRPIALMRSATAPVISRLKREASEVLPLGSIPHADSQSVQANRNGVLSKTFSRREVDMSILAPKVNAKKRTQVSVEAELKEAISALKKPNRELAGKALAETAEKRSASAPHSRKPKKPTQNPFFRGVQISATPKNNRFKNVFTEAKSQSISHVVEEADPAAIPPSSQPRVPQSVSRQSRDEQTKDPLSFIEATPTRKASSNPAQRGNLFLDVAATEHGGCEPLSPLQMGRSSSQLFNLSPETNGPRNSWSSHAVQETPVKQKAGAMLVHSHPILATPIFNKENLGLTGGARDNEKLSFEKAEDVSIYKSLGWDDADDD